MTLLPGYIESELSRRVDFGILKKYIAESITARTGLNTKIQGVRFDLWHGIIFFGVRLYPETEISEQTYLFNTESLVLETSYWNLIRRRFPFKQLKIERGKLNLDALSYAEWKRFFKKLVHPEENRKVTPPETSLPEYQLISFDSLPIEIEDISVTLPIRKGDLSDIRLFMTLKPETAAYHASFTLRSQRKSQEQEKARTFVSAGGNWDANGHGTLQFQMFEVPFRFLYDLIQQGRFIGEEFAESTFAIGSGSVSGDGTINFRENEIGIQLITNYENLTLSVPDQTNPLFALRGNGNWGFSATIDTETGDNGSFVSELQNPFARIDVDYKVTKAQANEKQKNALDLKGMISFPQNKTESAPSLSFTDGYGDLVFHYHKTDPDFSFTESSEGEIQIKNFVIRLPKELTEKSVATNSKKLPDLFIHTGQLTLDKGLKLDLAGEMPGAKIKINAKSPIKIVRNRSNRPFLLEQNWDLDAELNELSWKRMTNFIFRIHSYVLNTGSKADARKAEDSGPIWEHGFMSRPLYVRFLRPLAIQGSIQANDITDTNGSLPNRLRFAIRKRQGMMVVELDPVQNDAANIRFSYSLDLERQLPHHELKFDATLKHNSISLYELTGIKSPPETVTITYMFGGDGLYAGDMVARSWSGLNLDLGQVNLSDFAPLTLALQSASLQSQHKNFEQFLVSRSTDGPLVTYRGIHLKSDELDAHATGNYTPYGGGNISAHYVAPNQQRSGQIHLKILQDGSYVPDTRE